MRSLVRFITLVGATLVAFAGVDAQPAEPRQRIRLDDNWRFALGHASDPDQDFGHATGYFSYLAKTGFGDGPANPAFDSRAWRIVDLPHDWAVELPFSPKAGPSHGFKAIGRGFPEHSIGWYRRTFFIPESDLGRRVALEFEGIYRDADVFVNGFFVGNEPSGYLDQFYDVTEYIAYGSENVVVVRVDASMEEGWYYEGAGIYRSVWLHKYDPLHVARHGTWVRSVVDEDAAPVFVETTVKNDATEHGTYRYTLRIHDPDGMQVAQKVGEPASIEGMSEARTIDTLTVDSPRRWSLEDPAIHTLVTEITDGAGRLVDRTEMQFGIRSIRFDPDHGFFLNGKHVVLKGTNNHQDHAGVGIAVPKALQEWRRRVFNGLAQVLIQTTGEPGEISLRATSGGLEAGRLVIVAK